jgi:uracil-DNA glycosylase
MEAFSSSSFTADLAAARIGGTYNQYAESELRRSRLSAYLASHAGAEAILVGEAAGYRGARISGIPFTSERQLTGTGPAEATATIVHRVLSELGLEDVVLLWNVVPTHPGTVCSNRPPTRREIAAARPFLDELTRGRRVIPVGRVAGAALGVPCLRHPSHGGAELFARGLRAAFATIPPRRGLRAASS